MKYNYTRFSKPLEDVTAVRSNVRPGVGAERGY